MTKGKPQSMLRVPLQIALVLVMLGFTVARAKTIECPGIGIPGDTSISADAVEKYTDVAITDLSTVAGWTFIKIHSHAIATGLCYGQAEVEGACILTGWVYERNVNHTSVYVDIVSTGLNGNYFVGNVYGMNPNYTTHDWQDLNTRNSNNTGPNQFLLSYPGSYQFHIKAYVNTTPCDLDPDETDTVNLTFYVSEGDEETAAVSGPRRNTFVVRRNTPLFEDGLGWLKNQSTLL